MPWDHSQPTAGKYRTKAHRQYVAYLKAELRRLGLLECTAVHCRFNTRAIVNPNGNEPDGLTAGHADNGVDYDGPQHRLCNARDGAVRARAKQDRETRLVL